MATKTPNPVIEEILKVSEDSLMIVKNPNGLGNDTWRVYSSGENAAALDSEEELKGFEKSLKMQKVTARLAEVASDDWDISWAWSLQAKTDTLDEFLKSADKLEMTIVLTDVVIGELTEEDLPRPKKEKSLVSMGGGAGSGVWSGTPEDLDKYMRENGMPSIFGTDSEDDDTSENSSPVVPTKKSADELIEDMLNGKFEGDPIEGLFEIGKALAEEPEPEDEDTEAEAK
jgi:hypothetical protein